jgi:hypothetical protein
LTTITLFIKISPEKGGFFMAQAFIFSEEQIEIIKNSWGKRSMASYVREFGCTKRRLKKISHRIKFTRT